MSLPDSESLLTALQKCRGQFYFWSSQKVLQRAIRIYSDSQVSHFQWKDEGRTLLAIVKNPWEFHVEFCLSEDRELLRRCTCPLGETGATCEHQLAALMTLLHAVNDVPFTKAAASSLRAALPYHKKILLNGLSQNPPTRSTITRPVHSPTAAIQPGNTAQPRIRLAGEFDLRDPGRLRGKLAPEVSTHVPGKPWTRSQLLSALGGYGLAKNSALEDWLLCWFEALPEAMGLVRFRTTRGVVDLKPSAVVVLENRWQFRLDGDCIAPRNWIFAVEDPGADELDPALAEGWVIAGETIAIHLEAKRLGVLPRDRFCEEVAQRTRAWEKRDKDFLSSVQAAWMGENTLLPVESWNEFLLPFTLLDDDSSFEFYDAKRRRLSILPQVPSFTIDWERPSGGPPASVTVRSHNLAGDLALSLLMSWIEDLNDSRQALFQSTERRRVVRDMLWKYLQVEDRTERAALRREFEKTVQDMSRRAQMGTETRLWFQEVEERVFVEGIRAVLVDLCQEDPWVEPVEMERHIARLMAILSPVLPEKEWRVQRMVDPVPALRIYLKPKPDPRGWSALQVALEQSGAQVLWDGKPSAVLTPKIQVSVRPTDQIDFFELHESVACFDQPMSQEAWEKMLLEGGAADAEGRWHVLDGESIARLELLKKVNGPRLKKEARQPAKVHRLRLLDWLDLRRSGVPCELPAEWEAIFQSLESFDQLPAWHPPQGLRVTLRPYQLQGAAWLDFLYRHRFGACLADDMGLGKTVQTIAFLGGITERPVHGASGRHLLVLPPTLLFNWHDEFQRFFPAMRLYDYVGSERRIPEEAGVVLTTYELARRDSEKLSQVPWDVAIFDEAQAVKNLTGGRSQAVREIPARFRICLTGTPLENHVGEFFSIMDLAIPGLLGDAAEFKRQHAHGEATPVLRRARPFLLRRTKEAILHELPPKVEQDIHLEMSELQRRYYTRAVAEVRAEVLAAYRDKTASQAGIIALAALTRLRQICISPALMDANCREVSPKLQRLVEDLNEVIEEHQAALVFSSFTRALDVLQHVLTQANIRHQRLDGSTPPAKRRQLVEAFQNPKGPPIFLISIKAGGAGLNLTRASHVFHLDPWWNPAVENQASDRVHRLGQKSTVFIHRLLMRHSIEDKITELKQRKRKIFERILSGGSVGETQGLISRDDMEFLLQ